MENANHDEKIFALVGYLAFLFVVPLIAKPKSEFCRFHAKQSMVMFLISIVVLIVLAAVPLFGSLVTMALFALYVLAIYRAYNGEMWRIPVVAGFADKINLDAFYGKAGASLSKMADVGSKMGAMKDQVSEGMKNLTKEHEEKSQEEEKSDSPPREEPKS